MLIRDKVGTFEITVRNSITRDRGSFRILKVFDAPGGVVVPASFAVRYDCGAWYKGWVSVAPNSPVTDQRIPTGSTCEVRELKPKDIPDFTWGPVTYSPESVVIGKDTPVEISVTNTLTGGGGEGAGGGPSKGGGGAGQPPTDTLVPTDSVSAASGPVDGISWILLISPVGHGHPVDRLGHPEGPHLRVQSASIATFPAAGLPPGTRPSAFVRRRSWGAADSQARESTTGRVDHQARCGDRDGSAIVWRHC